MSTFEEQDCFPFDFSDRQSELYVELMKAQSSQKWSGLDLKIIVHIVLGPYDNKLSVILSLFKRLPKSVQFNWKSSPNGDSAVAPGPPTPFLMDQNSPETPEKCFQPLTQRLDPRSNKNFTPVRAKSKIVPFSLELSTITCESPEPVHKESTPDKSNSLSPANSSKSSVKNRSKYSPIVKPRKRYSISPTPKEIRVRNSLILDGREPVPKRAKLDKSVGRRRPKAKARRSIKSFLNSLIQSNIC